MSWPLAQSYWAWCDSPHGLTVGWKGSDRSTYEAAKQDADAHSNISGDVVVWLIKGTTVTQAPVVASGIPLAWQIAAVQDLDGDGHADLIWRQTQTGDVAVWLMNGP